MILPEHCTLHWLFSLYHRSSLCSFLYGFLITLHSTLRLNELIVNSFYPRIGMPKYYDYYFCIMLPYLIFLKFTSIRHCFLYNIINLSYKLLFINSGVKYFDKFAILTHSVHYHTAPFTSLSSTTSCSLTRLAVTRKETWKPDFSQNSLGCYHESQDE